MMRQIAISIVVGLTLCGIAPGDSVRYNEAAAALQAALNGEVFESDSHTPGNVTIRVVADEKGVLTITQNVERDQPDLFFHSSTQQTWIVRASDIDVKRIAMKTEPLSVYAPTKKDKRLIQVSRTETKSRIEGGHEPAEDWQQRDTFMTNFVTIPAASVESAETAAELLKQIAKSAPETPQ